MTFFFIYRFPVSKKINKKIKIIKLRVEKISNSSLDNKTTNSLFNVPKEKHDNLKDVKKFRGQLQLKEAVVKNTNKQ